MSTPRIVMIGAGSGFLTQVMRELALSETLRECIFTVVNSD
jgi:protein-L-isoaspartate O-methyltransferase